MTEVRLVKQEELLAILQTAIGGDTFVLSLPQVSMQMAIQWGHQTEFTVVLNKPKLQSVQTFIEEETNAK